MICRKKSREGRSFRLSVGRLFGTVEPDFECPKKLPWLTEEPTPDELLKFNNLVAEVLLEPAKSKDEHMQVAFSPALLQLLVDRRSEVIAVLQRDHKVVLALKNLMDAVSSPHGCTECRRKRHMRILAAVLDNSSLEDKRKLFSLVNENKGVV